MAVFRAPSASSAGDFGSTSNARRSASQLQRRNSSRVARRPRSGSVRPSSVDLAASKARRKRLVDNRPRLVPSRNKPYIYVGNVSIRTSPASLKKLFSVCGIVLDVVKRQTFFTEIEQPGVGITYATILFNDKDGQAKALLMNGAILDGCNLTVSHSAYDLPEPHRIQKKRSEARTSTNQPLCREPTLIVEAAQRMPTFGSSFCRKNLGTSGLPTSRGKDEKNLSTILEQT